MVETEHNLAMEEKKTVKCTWSFYLPVRVELTLGVDTHGEPEIKSIQRKMIQPDIDAQEIYETVAPEEIEELFKAHAEELGVEL